MDRLKKSANNCVNVTIAKSDLYLKDIKTFGAPDDYHIAPFNETELEHGENCERLLGAEGMEVKTTDLLTNETFVVKGDMLLHKGRKHTFDDIAPKWKKDCRTWLWKNKVCKKNVMVDELQRDLEKVEI